MSSKSKKGSLNRRDFLKAGSTAAMAATAAALFGLPSAKAFAQGKKRKVIFIPQDAGDWNAVYRTAHRDFFNMAGWEYQHIGNPVYSVENHLEQINIAINAKPDVIITELESKGIVSGFKKAIDAGILMIVTDQGLPDEAAALGVGMVLEDAFRSGTINGRLAAESAAKLSGKKEGVIVMGNGNPGSALIDGWQNGSQKGVEDYNAKNGTNFKFEGYADSEFFDVNESIQKWSAQIDQKGDSLVAALATSNPTPIVKALQDKGFKPGQLTIGSTACHPPHQELIDQGWVFWGISPQESLQGFMAAASAWMALERGFPVLNIGTGGELFTKGTLQKLKDRTAIWQAKAKEYGDLK